MQTSSARIVSDLEELSGPGEEEPDHSNMSLLNLKFKRRKVDSRDSDGKTYILDSCGRG